MVLIITHNDIRIYLGFLFNIYIKIINNMKDLKHIKRFNESDENLNISDVSRSLNDILFDLFLDGYELGIVSKDMKESDYIDARKEAIKKAIQEINTLK